jgi:hypothetical protein
LRSRNNGRLNLKQFLLYHVSLAQLTIVTENRGKMIHLLKQKSKPVCARGKRFKYNVPRPQTDAESQLEEVKEESLIPSGD